MLTTNRNILTATRAIWYKYVVNTGRRVVAKVDDTEDDISITDEKKEVAPVEEPPKEYSVKSYLLMYALLFISMGICMIVGFFSLKLFH